MSNPVLPDIIGQYGEFFKATDNFFNIVAAYSRRLNEETKKIKPDLGNNWNKYHQAIKDPDIFMEKSLL